MKKVVARYYTGYAPYEGKRRLTGYKVLLENGVWKNEYVGDEYEYIPGCKTTSYEEEEEKEDWSGIHCTVNGEEADKGTANKAHKIWILCECSPDDYIIPDEIIKRFFGSFKDWYVVKAADEMWLYLFDNEGNNTFYLHFWGEYFNEED